MINYGPELQKIVFGHEDYTCVSVKLDNAGARFEFVPKDTKLEVIDFVWPDWIDSISRMDSLHVTSTSITLKGDWQNSAIKDLLCNLEDVYEVTLVNKKHVILTHKGAVYCTMDTLTRGKMKAHLLDACRRCITIEHWHETLENTLRQTLVNITQSNTDIDDEAQARIERTLTGTFGRAFWIDDPEVIRAVILRLAESL